MAKIQKVGALLGLLVLLCTNTWVPLRAQGCLVYERQLETYFLNYKDDQAIDLRKIESVWEHCETPTAKMNLIYYYFRSAHALYDAQLSEVDAYEDASYYYDLAARDFDALVSVDRGERRFSDSYFTRADDLEAALRQEADRLRYYEEDRYYGSATGDPVWRKKVIGPANQSGQSRGMNQPAPTVFRKRSYRNGRYVETRIGVASTQEGTSRGTGLASNRRMASSPDLPTNEDYGYVGAVGEINLINYLRHSRSAESDAVDMADASETMEIPTGANQRRVESREDPLLYERTTLGIPAALDNAWVMDMDGGQGYYTPWLNAQEGTAIRVSAGDQSPELGVLTFGEVVAATTPAQIVRHPAGTYMQVQTEYGKRGWVRQDDFVESGKMAVITQNARGYLNTYTRQDRNAVLFLAGELVILESAREDWVRLVSRNLEKRGWIPGLEYLSIDELDLRIGIEMHKAQQESSLYARRARLEAIRDWPGFESSELREAVESRIEAATAYHSNR